jgi:hypothetical protein
MKKFNMIVTLVHAFCSVCAIADTMPDGCGSAMQKQVMSNCTMHVMGAW